MRYSFEDQVDDDQSPYAPPTPNTMAIASPTQMATQNPLGNMAGAASPGLTSGFDSVFGGGDSGGGMDLGSPQAASAPLAGHGSAPGQQGANLGGSGSIDVNASPWANLAGQNLGGSGGGQQGGNLGDGSGADAQPVEPPPSTPQSPTDMRTKSPGWNGASASGGDDIKKRFSSMASELANARDPQQQAILKDRLSRDIFGTLSDAGHDVKWEGEQLVVDGRRYVVGGGTDLGQYGEPGGFAGPQQSEPGGITGGQDTRDVHSGTAPQAQPQAFGQRPASGYDEGKWNDPNSKSAKYITARSINYEAMRKIPDEAGRKAFLVQEVARIKPQLEAAGWKVGRVEGDRMEIGGGPDNYPMNFVDIVGDIEGAATPAWNDGGGGGGAQAPAGGIQSLYDRIFAAGSAGAAGVDATSRHQNNGGRADPSVDPFAGSGGGQYFPNTGSWVPKNNPVALRQAEEAEAAAGAAGGGGAGGGGGITTGGAGGGPTGPYTPGTIDDSDLSGMTIDEIMSRIGPQTDPERLNDNYQAGYIDPNGLGDLGGGRTDPATEDLVMSILQNPESMGTRERDMLKAASKDELADMARADDENMNAFGYQNGIEDSNWLASERNARRGERDRSLVESNRAVDMKAMETNMADRRAAAGLGQGYAESKSGRNLADRGQRLTEARTNEGLRSEAADRNLKAAQQNIDNQFRSRAERQTAVKLAADTQLAAAAQKGDRRALEEQFKQKAVELGQSAEKIQQDYILARMSDATARYGIDVGASIDRAKLAQAGTEFQQDLIFRLAALEQADRQFGATYGLQHAQTEHQIDQDNWNRTFGS